MQHKNMHKTLRTAQERLFDRGGRFAELQSVTLIAGLPGGDHQVTASGRARLGSLGSRKNVDDMTVPIVAVRYKPDGKCCIDCVVQTEFCPGSLSKATLGVPASIVVTLG